jgi:hypothetical protein
MELIELTDAEIEAVAGGLVDANGFLPLLTIIDVSIEPRFPDPLPPPPPPGGVINQPPPPGLTDKKSKV